ncbi:MAG: NUDIX domain-containing protein [Chloroflexota bacterium]
MTKQQLCGNQWISLWQSESGTVTVKMDDGVTIVPINDDGNVIMISEPSVAYDGLRSLLLPTGGIEADEPPAETANRELQEEIGLKANKLDFLGILYSSIKYVEMKSHVFLARDFVPAELEGDEPEGWIQFEDPMPLSDIEAKIAEGKLLNAETISALFMARSFLEKEQLSS